VKKFQYQKKGLAVWHALFLSQRVARLSFEQPSFPEWNCGVPARYYTTLFFEE
jgi:hypothetical protein